MKRLSELTDEEINADFNPDSGLIKKSRELLGEYIKQHEQEKQSILLFEESAKKYFDECYDNNIKNDAK